MKVKMIKELEEIAKLEKIDEPFRDIAELKAIAFKRNYAEGSQEKEQYKIESYDCSMSTCHCATWS